MQRLFAIEKVKDNSDTYVISLLKCQHKKSFISAFLYLIGTLTTPTYDAFYRGWRVNQSLLPYFLDLETKCLGQMRSKHFFSAPKKATLGTRLKLPLYDYQEDVVSFILKTKTALLVAPCGAGKTPIAIASYEEGIHQGIIKGAGLIVVKASLKHQWVSEIRKFSHLTPKIIGTFKECVGSISSKIKRREDRLRLETDSARQRDLKREITSLKREEKSAFSSQFTGADLYVLNYETLSDEKVRRALHKMNIDFIFLDEVQYIKSTSTKRSRHVREFTEATMKIGATATPVQKDPRDVYGLYKFIVPSLFTTKSAFDALYVRFNHYGRVSGSKNEKALNEKIAPYMMLKTKEDVSKELPSLVVLERYCTLNPPQRAMHERLMHELDALKKRAEAFSEQFAEKELKENEEYQKIESQILSRQTFAQELCNSEDLLRMSPSSVAKSYVTGAKDNKLELLLGLVSEIIESGEKVCIFSRFTKMQPIIEKAIMGCKDIPPVQIAKVDGSLPGERRYEEIYTKFRDNDAYKILLCSDAVAEGVNISTAKYLIEYDLATSYAIQTQRHGRIQRASSIHQTVFVYQLIAEGSWDEVQHKIVSKKESYDLKIVQGIHE